MSGDQAAVRRSASSWDELQHMSDAGSLYAIVDACGSPPVQQYVQSNSSLATCLYRGVTGSQSLSRHAPYLLAVSQSTLDWISATLRDEPWGIFLELSDKRESPQRVATHLRELLQVSSPTGEIWIFRYYDPRVIGPFLLSCDASEASRFFGQISSIIVARNDARPEAYTLSGELRVSTPQPRVPGPLFKIRTDHINSLRTESPEVVPRRALNYILERGYEASYDAHARTITVHDTGARLTKILFDERGLPARIEIPSGDEIVLTTDPAGKTRKFEFPGGRVLTYDHDETNKVIEIGLPRGRTFKVTDYDGDPVVHYPDGTQSATVHERDASVVHHRDRLGYTTTIHSIDDRVQLRTDRLGRTTSFQRDDCGSLEVITYSDGTIESLSFNRMSRALSHFADGELIATHLYDANYALHSTVYPDGHVDEHFFKSRQLISTRNVYGSTSSMHDHKGHLVRHADGVAAYACAYDAWGNIVEIEDEQGTLAYKYEYDCNNELNRVHAWGLIAEVERVPLGPVTGISWTRNGQEQLRVHFVSSDGVRPSRVVSSRSGQVVSDDNYEYDALGRLTHATQRDQYGIESIALSLDDEGRVLLEDRRGGDGVRNVQSFTYDREGNLVSADGTPVWFGTNNQPCVDAHGQPIAYDKGGRISAIGTGRNAVRYDWRGKHLTRVITDDVVIENEHDVAGHRTRRCAGGVETRYSWLGDWLLQELYVERDELVSRREYLYLPIPQVNGGLHRWIPIAFCEGGRIFMMVNDARGAPVRVIDEDGKMVWRASYSSFGECDVTVCEVSQAWRLAGMYADVDAHVLHAPARCYNLLARSFMSRDPYWPDERCTEYSYCGNRPWDSIDPSGNMALSLSLLLAAFAITAVAMVMVRTPAFQDAMTIAIDGTVDAVSNMCVVCATQNAKVEPKAVPYFWQPGRGCKSLNYYPGSAGCENLKGNIEKVRAEIGKRWQDLKLDTGGLKHAYDGPELPIRASRRKHWALYYFKKAQLGALRAWYAACCGG